MDFIAFQRECNLLLETARQHRGLRLPDRPAEHNGSAQASGGMAVPHPTERGQHSRSGSAMVRREMFYVDDSGNELLQLPSAARRSSAHLRWGESSESLAADCDQRQRSRRQRSEPLMGACSGDVTASVRGAENASECCFTTCVPGSPCAPADVTTVLRKRCPRRVGDTADRQPFLEIHAVTN